MGDMEKFLTNIYSAEAQGADSKKLASAISNLPEDVLFQMAESKPIVEDTDEELIAKFAAAQQAGKVMAQAPQLPAPPVAPPMPQAMPEPETPPPASDPEIQSVVGASVLAAAEAGKRIGEESSVSNNLQDPGQPAPVLPPPQGAPPPVGAPPGGVAQKMVAPQPATAMPAKMASFPWMSKTAGKTEAAMGLGKKLLLGGIGVGAAAGTGYAGHEIGESSGLKTGRGQGLRAGAKIGLTKGYQAGARRGYIAGARRGYGLGLSTRSGQKKVGK